MFVMVFVVETFNCSLMVYCFFFKECLGHKHVHRLYSGIVADCVSHERPYVRIGTSGQKERITIKLVQRLVDPQKGG